MLCPAPYDTATGKQTAADYCIPRKTGDCWNFCPMPCAPTDQVCPGPAVAPPTDSKSTSTSTNCPNPDVCMPADGTYVVKSAWKFVLDPMRFFVPQVMEKENLI